MELHQNDLLTPDIVHIAVIFVPVDKNLFLLCVPEDSVRTVSSPLTKEMEGADRPDTAKLWRVQNTGKLCLQMDNKNMKHERV